MPQSAMPQDLAEIVDRLVAARQALVPTQAQIAIDHADFGEIGLRFEQDMLGELAVELSSPDPELRRVVTHVAAQEALARTGDQAAAPTGRNPATDPGLGTGQHDRGTREGRQHDPRQGESPKGNPAGSRKREDATSHGNEDGIFA